MTAKVAALLRGVNIGSKRKVEMATLRKLLEGLGFDDVKTYLQSGNAVFSPGSVAVKDLPGLIEGAIAEEYGMSSTVIIRTNAQLKRCIADDPLAGTADHPSRYQVGFLSAQPAKELVAKLTGQDYGPDQLRVIGDHLYMWCPNGISQSPFFKMKLGRDLKVGLTARNWNTVLKLEEMTSS